MPLGDGHTGQNACQREHGADGKIDTGGDDDHAHADGENAVERELADDRNQVARGQELLTDSDGQQQAHGQQDDQNAERIALGRTAQRAAFLAFVLTVHSFSNLSATFQTDPGILLIQLR